MAIISFLVVATSTFMMIFNSYKRMKNKRAMDYKGRVLIFVKESDTVSTFSQPSSAQNISLSGDHMAESDLEKFKAHLSKIHDLLRASYERVLIPWKVNENVSVSVQEDGFGSAMIRVTLNAFLDNFRIFVESPRNAIPRHSLG